RARVQRSRQLVGLRIGGLERKVARYGCHRGDATPDEIRVRRVDDRRKRGCGFPVWTDRLLGRMEAKIELNGRLFETRRPMKLLPAEELTVNHRLPSAPSVTNWVIALVTGIFMGENVETFGSMSSGVRPMVFNWETAQMSPSRLTVIPTPLSSATVSVMKPPGVILPSFPPSSSVNHTLPSGPATMPS